MTEEQIVQEHASMLTDMSQYALCVGIIHKVYFSPQALKTIIDVNFKNSEDHVDRIFRVLSNLQLAMIEHFGQDEIIFHSLKTLQNADQKNFYHLKAKIGENGEVIVMNSLEDNIKNTPTLREFLDNLKGKLKPPRSPLAIYSP